MLLQALQEMSHDCDLQPSGHTHVHLDAAHMGVGGDDSWSPSVREQYLVPPGTFSFRFALLPTHAWCVAMCVCWICIPSLVPFTVPLAEYTCTFGFVCVLACMNFAWVWQVGDQSAHTLPYRDRGITIHHVANHLTLLDTEKGEYWTFYLEWPLRHVFLNQASSRTILYSCW